jgi:hypothetical protein
LSIHAVTKRRNGRNVRTQEQARTHDPTRRRSSEPARIGDQVMDAGDCQYGGHARGGDTARLITYTWVKTARYGSQIQLKRN